MAPASVVRKTARTALQNKYFKCVAVSLITIASFGLISLIFGLILSVSNNIFASAVFIPLTVAVIIPLLLGVIRFFQRLVFGVDDEPIEVFFYFSSKSDYVRALKFSVSLTVRVTVYALILFLPSLAVRFLASQSLYEFLKVSIPIWTSSLSPIISFLDFIGGVGVVWVILKYYMTPFLFVSNKDIDVAEAFHLSVVISRRSLFYFMTLFFSMLLYILPSLLLLPLIFTLPYFLTAYSVHCRFGVAEYNKTLNFHFQTE